MKNFKELFTGKSFRGVVIVGISVVALLMAFAAGVTVGEHRARYSSAWGYNYERNFLGGPRAMMGRGIVPPGGPMGFDDRGQGMMRDFPKRDFRNGHGIAGTIISVADNMIVIKDRDGKENTVVLTDRTIIKHGRSDIQAVDLKNDQRIVVIGNPGDTGAVEADLIRVFENNNR